MDEAAASGRTDTLLLQAAAPLCAGLARVTVHAPPPPAPPRHGPPAPAPSLAAATRVAVALGGASSGVAVVAPTWGDVTLVCRKARYFLEAVSTVYRALSAVSEGAGLAVGAVAASVTFAPPAPNNADAAAAAAVAAALRARGWCALTPGVFIDAHDYATAAPGVPRACAVARIVRASVRAPNNLLLTVNVGISRFKPVSPAAVALLPGSGAYGEVGSDGDAAFAGRALDGYVCCMLPDLCEVAVVGVVPRAPEDAPLLASWAACLAAGAGARSTPLAPPPYWVKVLPADEADGDHDARDGWRLAPLAALWAGPPLALLPAASRVAGGAGGLLRRLADDLSAGGSNPFWGGSLTPKCLVVNAGNAALAGGGWRTAAEQALAAPAVQLVALPPRASAPPPPAPVSDNLKAYMEEAACTAKAALAAATAAVPARTPVVRATGLPTVPGRAVVPAIGRRKLYTLGASGGVAPGLVVRKGGAAALKKAAKPAGRKPAAAASGAPGHAAMGSGFALAAASAPKPAPKAKKDVDAAAACARVCALAAAGTLAAATMDELKAFLKSSKLPVGGKKAVLVERAAGALGAERAEAVVPEA